MNKSFMNEKADMVFQTLACGVYVMTKNRKGMKTDKVYEAVDLDYFVNHGVSIRIIQ
ncbi:hypothetical protein [Brevibacillus porteri]|uniref:hypothetical protein n=1 Tax=Brevibacillus porteri TaxID=2126350 RepID=UPI003645EC85